MTFKELDPSELIHRVVWQSATYSLNESNQQVPTWNPVGTYWSRVEPLTGREAITAKQLKATLTHKVTLRQVGNMKPTDRLVWIDPQGNTRTLNLDFVFPIDGRNAGYSLMCTELVQPQ